MSDPIPTRLRLGVGETVALRLTGRGTAGYTWQSVLHGPAVIATSLDLAAEAPPRDSEGAVPPGASRAEVLTLRALQPGEAVLEIVQRRLWETDQPPLEQHWIDIEVAP